MKKIVDVSYDDADKMLIDGISSTLYQVMQKTGLRDLRLTINIQGLKHVENIDGEFIETTVEIPEKQQPTKEMYVVTHKDGRESWISDKGHSSFEEADDFLRENGMEALRRYGDEIIYEFPNVPHRITRVTKVKLQGGN